MNVLIAFWVGLVLGAYALAVSFSTGALDAPHTWTYSDIQGELEKREAAAQAAIEKAEAELETIKEIRR